MTHKGESGHVLCVGVDAGGSIGPHANQCDVLVDFSAPEALAANLDVFTDVENLQRISRYVKTGQFPWEAAT